VKKGTFRRGAPVGALPQELSSFQLTGEPIVVQIKKIPSGARQKRQRKQNKANAAPQADGGPEARGAHNGESCTGTDVDNGVAVAQNDRCHLAGHLRMTRAR